jgi:hypothetical protein
MEHPVLTAIGRAGFAALGWFAPETQDGLPAEARFVILIGNAAIPRASSLMIGRGPW